MNPIVRIQSRSADLGDGMVVHRALPSRQQRMVGAWCFLDHAGLVDFGPGRGMHVGALGLPPRFTLRRPFTFLKR